MPSSHRRGRRGPLSGLSCFGGSPVADSDAGHRPVSSAKGGRGASSGCFTWSGSRKKKTKTVPLDASPTASAAEDQLPQAGEDDAAEGGAGKEPLPTAAPQPPAPVPSQSFFGWLRKGSKDPRQSTVKTSRAHGDQVSSYHQKEQPPPPTWLPSYPAKYSARRCPPEPPPPEPSRPPASRAAGGSPAAASPDRGKPPAKQARTSGAAARPHAVRNDQVVGLSVLAVVLVVMVAVGRVGAILCTCAWFYLLPRVRRAAEEGIGGGGGKSSAAAVDLDSEEHKKRVVLEGLLQRNGRRPAAGFST
uniref:Uncharacterized protein At5g23160 n=1 Tax=Anthurium amnicola TaxID=1678845 RepID=A0A1D1ZH78_9ARAE